jgi:hypothetical protein
MWQIDKAVNNPGSVPPGSDPSVPPGSDPKVPEVAKDKVWRQFGRSKDKAKTKKRQRNDKE